MRYLGIGLSLIILLAICFGIVNIFILQKKKSAIEIKRREIYMQISHWQKIENKYSGYRDANFTLAALEYQLGDYVKAKFYLNKALLLDPNFELGRKLEKNYNNYSFLSSSVTSSVFNASSSPEVFSSSVAVSAAAASSAINSFVSSLIKSSILATI